MKKILTLFALPILIGCSPEKVHVFGCDLALPSGFKLMEHSAAGSRYFWNNDELENATIQILRGQFVAINEFEVDNRQRVGPYELIRFKFNQRVVGLAVARNNEHAVLYGDRAQIWLDTVIQRCP